MLLRYVVAVFLMNVTKHLMATDHITVATGSGKLRLDTGPGDRPPRLPPLAYLCQAGFLLPRFYNLLNSATDVCQVLKHTTLWGLNIQTATDACFSLPESLDSVKCGHLLKCPRQ